MTNFLNICLSHFPDRREAALQAAEGSQAGRVRGRDGQHHQPRAAAHGSGQPVQGVGGTLLGGSREDRGQLNYLKTFFTSAK